MSSNQVPLVIKDFQSAVADSPNLGHSLMRNIDIESFPGGMKTQSQLLSMFSLITAQTCTVVAATDVFTAGGTLSGSGFTGQAVIFSTTTTLPAPLVAGTVYFLIFQSSTTFKVATTIANANAGTAIDITTTGTGVHTVTPVSPGTITNIVKNQSTGYFFLQDSNGRVWYSLGVSTFLLNGNTLTNASGNGLCTFLVSDASASYLFVFRNASIDIIPITGTSNLETPVWTNNWQAMNTGAGTGNRHHAILAQDNIIYFTDDRYVGSFQEKAGSVFVPATGATFTYNNKALTLPQGEISNVIEELGSNILVGGLTFNKIYPWDRFSGSFYLPLSVPEVGIYQMKNLGSTVYILAGIKGNIYTTQGTYVTLKKTIPGYIANNPGTVQAGTVTWGGISQRNGALLFGVSTQTTANNGVYILFPDGRLLQDNTPSIGGSNATAIYAESDFYRIGYAGGADYHDTSRYASGTFASVAQSELFRIGNKTQKATYSNLELLIAKPSTTGQIRISYRFDTSSSFTTLTTFNSDSVSTSFDYDCGITDIENIQFQVEFDGNVEIMQLALFP
jgi:hypothetical protein